MNDSISKHDQVLLSLIMHLQHASMVQLGKVADPTTGEVTRNLEAARATIDILEMLKAKCREGTPAELVKMMDQVVMELQMNYLDESKKSDDATGDDEPDDAPAPDAPEEPRA